MSKDIRVFYGPYAVFPKIYNQQQHADGKEKVSDPVCDKCLFTCNRKLLGTKPERNKEL